jgi:hypothetical protein
MVKLYSEMDSVFPKFSELESVKEIDWDSAQEEAKQVASTLLVNGM